MALTNRPKRLLRIVVDPRNGFLAEERFPTIAALNDWMDKHTPEPRQSHPEHRLLPPVQEEPVDPADRARRVKMLRDTAQAIRAAAEKITVGAKLPPVQMDSDELRMKALKNLEAGKQKANEDAA